MGYKLPEPIPNSEVKLLLARLVLPWGTRWESRVLFSFCGPPSVPLSLSLFFYNSLSFFCWRDDIRPETRQAPAVLRRRASSHTRAVQHATRVCSHRRPVRALVLAGCAPWWRWRARSHCGLLSLSLLNLSVLFHGAGPAARSGRAWYLA